MHMPNPYPIELRERAVRAYEEGDEAHTVIAERLSLNPWTLLRWVVRKRATGSVAPLPKGGGQKSRVDGELLERLVRERPEATLDELTVKYNQQMPRGWRVHRSSIVRALQREEYVFKKNARGLRNSIGRTSKPNARHSASKSPP